MGASVDVIGRAGALAFLALHWGWAADASPCAVCAQPRDNIDATTMSIDGAMATATAVDSVSKT